MTLIIKISLVHDGGHSEFDISCNYVRTTARVKVCTRTILPRQCLTIRAMLNVVLLTDSTAEPRHRRCLKMTSRNRRARVRSRVCGSREGRRRLLSAFVVICSVTNGRIHPIHVVCGDKSITLRHKVN